MQKRKIEKRWPSRRFAITLVGRPRGEACGRGTATREARAWRRVCWFLRPRIATIGYKLEDRKGISFFAVPRERTRYDTRPLSDRLGTPAGEFGDNTCTPAGGTRVCSWTLDRYGEYGDNTWTPIGRESPEHLIRIERRVQENMPGRPFDMESSATIPGRQSDGRVQRNSRTPH